MEDSPAFKQFTTVVDHFYGEVYANARKNPATGQVTGWPATDKAALMATPIIQYCELFVIIKGFVGTSDHQWATHPPTHVTDLSSALTSLGRLVQSSLKTLAAPNPIPSTSTSTSEKATSSTTAFLFTPPTNPIISRLEGKATEFRGVGYDEIHALESKWLSVEDWLRGGPELGLRDIQEVMSEWLDGTRKGLREVEEAVRGLEKLRKLTEALAALGPVPSPTTDFRLVTSEDHESRKMAIERAQQDLLVVAWNTTYRAFKYHLQNSTAWCHSVKPSGRKPSSGEGDEAKRLKKVLEELLKEQESSSEAEVGSRAKLKKQVEAAEAEPPEYSIDAPVTVAQRTRQIFALCDDVFGPDKYATPAVPAAAGPSKTSGGGLLGLFKKKGKGKAKAEEPEEAASGAVEASEQGAPPAYPHEEAMRAESRKGKWRKEKEKPEKS
ncbi:intracellular protein transport protein (Sat1) [Pseudohyphozyma bogoriensis]|nr:intracellular protein transport protein (Sat1) [Pseudohyphozyma bogoriensis]